MTEAYIGAAFSPFDPTAGLATAKRLVGDARCDAIAAGLANLNGEKLQRVIDLLVMGWHSSAPVGAAVETMHRLGPDALQVALAARQMAQRGAGFDRDVIAGLAPGVLMLSGAPRLCELEKKRD